MTHTGFPCMRVQSCLVNILLIAVYCTTGQMCGTLWRMWCMYVCVVCVGTVLLLFACVAVIFQKSTAWNCAHHLVLPSLCSCKWSYGVHHMHNGNLKAHWGFIHQVVLKPPGNFYQVLILLLGCLQRSWVPWDKLQSGSHWSRVCRAMMTSFPCATLCKACSVVNICLESYHQLLFVRMLCLYVAKALWLWFITHFFVLVGCV